MIPLIPSIKNRFPFLHYTALLHLVAFVLVCLAIIIDDRELLGVNVWIKPAKFLVSTFIFLWTVGWYLKFYPFREKTKTWIANSFSILMFVENSVISLQAGRGVRSHYNVSSAFDATLFSAMGLAIGSITLLVFWIFIKSFSSKLQLNSGMKWSIRIAWFAFLFASLVGSLMIRQLAHNVGVPDGGVGLPFLNWSTSGGDLRIAHFFGLHAIQVIPLFAFFSYKKIESAITARNLSIGFGLLYLGWIVFVFLQAQSGQPLMPS